MVRYKVKFFPTDKEFLEALRYLDDVGLATLFDWLAMIMNGRESGDEYFDPEKQSFAITMILNGKRVRKLKK